MRAVSLLLGLLLALGALPARRAHAAEDDGAATAATPRPFAALTARMEAERTRRGLPGAGLAVWRDGDFTYRRFFGSYRADTAVPIASATKWISAAVILTVVDAGELDLDAPTSRHLPDLPPEMGRVTVRQLLSMTAGVPRRRRFGRSFPSLTAFVAYFGRERKLLGEPGRDFRYGGDGFQLAGRAAEVATGRSFRSLFRERVALPCGMEHTHYDAAGARAMPLLYGGIRTTLDDYVRFLAMLLSNGRCGDTRVLSADAILEMHRNQTGELRLRDAGPGRLERQSRYGLGSWIDELGPDGRAVQSSSPGSFGFTPWIEWKHGVAGVLMQVATDPARGMIPPFEIIEATDGALRAVR